MALILNVIFSGTSLSVPQRPLNFDTNNFFTSLRAHDTPFTLRRSKSNSVSHLIAFYNRFLLSPNFKAWLHQRIFVAENAMRERYLGTLGNADLDRWINRPGRTDAEIDDLFSRLQLETVS